LRILQHPDWFEEEDPVVALATDLNFKTVRRTPNLGDVEPQEFFDFSTVEPGEHSWIQMGEEEFVCYLHAILRDDKPVRYIITGASVETISGYLGILGTSLLVSLGVLIPIGILVGYLLSNQLTDPMRAIREVVARMGKERLGRIQSVGSDSKIEQMIETQRPFWSTGGFV